MHLLLHIGRQHAARHKTYLGLLCAQCFVYAQCPAEIWRFALTEGLKLQAEAADSASLATHLAPTPLLRQAPVALHYRWMPAQAPWPAQATLAMEAESQLTLGGAAYAVACESWQLRAFGLQNDQARTLLLSQWKSQRDVWQLQLSTGSSHVP